LITVAEVERIAALEDAALRNLQITQCYAELSRRFSWRTGPSANWCTFATWASKQAGQTIRKEDLRQALEHLLTTAPATSQAAGDVASAAQQIGAKGDAEEIKTLIWQVVDPAAAIERASQAVGRGNLKVFAEIGAEFARFCADCLEDAAFDLDRIARFCEAQRPGEPPEGQRYLRQAFMHYYQSFFESDAKKRTELLLLANLEIGFHEQTRLQPEIAASLDAGYIDPRQIAPRLIGAIFPYLGLHIHAFLVFMRLLRGGPTLFDIAVDRLATAARSQLHQLITEHLMAISLPHGVQIRLGEDLNAPYPPLLQQITLLDLRSLLEQIDPTPDSPRGSGAVDWANLPDRLHFIVDLFRCYQESPDLFEPPFTPEQVTELEAGRIPAGPL